MASQAFSLDRFLGAPPLARALEVDAGLPASAVRALLKDGTATLSDIAGIVAKRRTLDRRLAADEPLTLDESDRFARLAEIVALATHVLGDKARAMAWLREPKARLDGARPLDLMRTHAGADLVANLLHLAQHGMLA